MTLTDLLNHGLQLLAMGVLALGAREIQRLTPKLADWLHLQSDAEVRDYLQVALNAAVGYGLAQARKMLPEQAAASATHPDVIEEAIRQAADYVEMRVPDALRRFQIASSDLPALVSARMPAATPLPAPAG